MGKIFAWRKFPRIQYSPHLAVSSLVREDEPRGHTLKVTPLTGAPQLGGGAHRTTPLPILGSHQRGISHKVYIASKIGRVHWLCGAHLWTVVRHPGKIAGKADWSGSVAMQRDKAAKCGHDGVKWITESWVNERRLW